MLGGVKPPISSHGREAKPEAQRIESAGVEFLGRGSQLGGPGGTL